MEGKTTLLLVAGLLLAGLTAALAIYNDALPRPPVVPSTVVTQVSNGLYGDAYAEIHTAFPPGSVSGTVLTSDHLPDNAVGLSWSPDGSRLGYFTREAPNVDGLATYTGVFVANADGSDPTPLELAHDVSRYVDYGSYHAGVSWAPSGERLAVVWGLSVCVEPQCPGWTDITETGVEIFDAAGAPIAAWDTGYNVFDPVIWSPDSAAIGWIEPEIEGCEEGCEIFRQIEGCDGCAIFHWRTLTDDAVTSLSLGGWETIKAVTWSTDNRVLVAEHHWDLGPGGKGPDVVILDRVYSMTPDGTDVRDVAWTRPQIPAWSPDGRMLVAADPVAGELVVLDLESGEESIVSIPTGLGFLQRGVGQWGPEGDRVMLHGEAGDGGSPYGLYLVNLDGSNTQPLGRAGDFGWMPASVSASEVAD